MGASKPTVVPVNGMIGVKTLLTVNLTADHRHRTSPPISSAASSARQSLWEKPTAGIIVKIGGAEIAF